MSKYAEKDYEQRERFYNMLESMLPEDRHDELVVGLKECAYDLWNKTMEMRKKYLEN